MLAYGYSQNCAAFKGLRLKLPYCGYIVTVGTVHYSNLILEADGFLNSLSAAIVALLNMEYGNRQDRKEAIRVPRHQHVGNHVQKLPPRSQSGFGKHARNSKQNRQGFRALRTTSGSTDLRRGRCNFTLLGCC